MVHIYLLQVKHLVSQEYHARKFKRFLQIVRRMGIRWMVIQATRLLHGVQFFPIRSLFKVRTFGANIQEVGDLHSNIIKDNLTTLASRIKYIYCDEYINEVKSNVRLDSSEADARLQILMLPESYLELCDKMVWKFVEKTLKAVIKHIILVVQ